MLNFMVPIVTIVLQSHSEYFPEDVKVSVRLLSFLFLPTFIEKTVVSFLSVGAVMCLTAFNYIGGGFNFRPYFVSLRRNLICA